MKPDPVQRVMDLYPRIFFACHTRHVEDPATRRTISFHQGSVLDHLDDVESTGLLDLARHMGVTASTMSLTVDRLVRAGYVTRSRDPGDGRRVRLRLTPGGVRIKEAKTVLDPARVRAMLSHLPRQKLARALEGLALLAGAAQEEMHNKALYGLRRRRTPRRSRSPKGAHHVEMDAHHSGAADRPRRADRPDR